MYRAFEERDPARRLQLAREALAVSPDCADAYVLLAEHTLSHKETLALYEKGMTAAEKTLGPEAFQRDVGHFWGLLETRPYMRARLGLAFSLWATGRREEAVSHLQDMLRLNPGDNQGVRYTLAGFLLFLDRDDDLARLLQQFPDDSLAAWAYNRALLAFRQHGDTPEARDLLKTARKTNKHIIAYLVGKKFPPAQPPTHYSPGDENEALEYVGTCLAGWKSTPGAIAWLRANSAKPKKDEPQPKGPLGFIKKWLTDHLKQEEDVWQVDCRQMPTWVEAGSERVRPWVVLVTSQSQGTVLAAQLLTETPSAALLWDVLAQAMQHPSAGEPHRPSEIQGRADERWESLKPHLEGIGVPLVLKEKLDFFEELFQHLTEQICGQPQPGLLDMPGMTPEQVGSFYESAAAFFRQAPWKKVGLEAGIKVQCDRYRGGPWYAVFMGQTGLLIGLAIYDNLESLRRMWAGSADEGSRREMVGTSVTFGEEWQVFSVADLEAARRHGWAVARPDAYPAVMHKEAADSRCVSLWPGNWN